MKRGAAPDRGLLAALVGDGRPLLSLTGVALFVSGLFAIFLATRREFLPHDIAFLGIGAEELCHHANCRIVAFMFHDRVAFGGTLISVAVLYLWLAAFPLRDGERWAWRAIAVSGAAGFVSFLAYLGYGYLDTWHDAATLALLPTFLVGLISSSRLAVRPPVSWLKLAPGAPATLRMARWMLLGTAGGLVAAGLTILFVGMTRVFVPQDLQFMGLDRAALDRISPRLIPLIAHDRAGFGGGLMSTGLLIAFCAWYAPPSRSFLEAIVAAGAAGFGCAIGVHFAEGYTDFVHLAPALVGALLFVGAVLLEIKGLHERAVLRASSFVREERRTEHEERQTLGF